MNLYQLMDNYIELKRTIKILSEIDEMDLLLAKIMYDIKPIRILNIR